MVDGDRLVSCIFTEFVLLSQELQIEPDRSEFVEYLTRLSESDWFVSHVTFTRLLVGVELATFVIVGAVLMPAGVYVTFTGIWSI